MIYWKLRDTALHSCSASHAFRKTSFRHNFGLQSNFVRIWRDQNNKAHFTGTSFTLRSTSLRWQIIAILSMYQRKGLPLSFSMSVEKLISSWKDQGLINDETAVKLLKDLNKRRSGIGLGTVLATIGGLLLGAAIILLVAANWQDIPRLVRVISVFALIWISYIGGVWRKLAGDEVFSKACFIIGAATFGAGIAMVGQMYHMSGDEASAALLWATGVFISAFLLREPVLAAAAMFISAFYLFSVVQNDFDILIYQPSFYIVPALALAGAVSAYFTRSRITGHLVGLFILLWFGLLYAENQPQSVLWILLTAGCALLLADGFAHVTLQRLTRFARPLAGYGFLAVLGAILAFQTRGIYLDQYDQPQILFYSAIILALCIGTLVLCGRNNSGLRWLVYLTFSAEVLYLAFETIGTIIGTSGFFLSSGILVLLLAVFVRRMEKRLSGLDQSKTELLP